jgi:hypothetical protein
MEDEATLANVLRSVSSKKYVEYDPMHQQGPYNTVHSGYDSDSDELSLVLV